MFPGNGFQLCRGGPRERALPGANVPQGAAEAAGLSQRVVGEPQHRARGVALRAAHGRGGAADWL